MDPILPFLLLFAADVNADLNSAVKVGDVPQVRALLDQGAAVGGALGFRQRPSNNDGVEHDHRHSRKHNEVVHGVPFIGSFQRRPIRHSS